MRHSGSGVANQEKVLRVLRSAAAPMTAYAVMKSVQSSRAWRPPTVYRALKRLVDAGVVHRIESINAYVICAHDRHRGAAAVIAICRTCGGAEELAEGCVFEQLTKMTQPRGFRIEQAIIELTGQCARCAERPSVKSTTVEDARRELTG